MRRNTFTIHRKLSKMMKAVSHVVILDVILDRKHFTRHGMHLNSTGKERIVRSIGQYLAHLLTKQRNNILPLPWADDSKDTNLWKEKESIENTGSLEMFVNNVRASGRPKKPPVTRTEDFLW
jgi:hypothetical protein